MTTTMTRFLSLGVLVTVLVLNAWPVGAASQRAQAPVTIRVSTWDTGNAGLKPYQVGIKAFEATNPGIKVGSHYGQLSDTNVLERFPRSSALPYP
jgi:ABC-type glycerol-3-phosphate transport system substrate-binding protein